MRRVIPVVVVALSLLVPVGAGGDTWDGNKLLEYCTPFVEGKSGDLFQQGYCVGFVGGVVHALILARDMPAAVGYSCLPDGVTNGQVARIVHKWLQENPEHLHERQVLPVIYALVRAFPCETPTPAAPAPGPGE